MASVPCVYRCTLSETATAALYGDSEDLSLSVQGDRGDRGDQGDDGNPGAPVSAQPIARHDTQ